VLTYSFQRLRSILGKMGALVHRSHRGEKDAEMLTLASDISLGTKRAMGVQIMYVCVSVCVGGRNVMWGKIIHT